MNAKGVSVFYHKEMNEIIMLDWNDLRKFHRLYNQDRTICVYSGMSKSMVGITRLTRHFKYLGEL